MGLLPYDTSADQAAKLLARSIKSRLQIDVDPERLREYIAQNWNTLSYYSHVIHNEHVRNSSALSNRMGGVHETA